MHRESAASKREPHFAKKLSKRGGATLVAWSVSGGYLRVFQEEIEPWRARQLVTRYLRVANEVILGGTRTPNDFDGADKVITADKRGGSTFRVQSKKRLKDRTPRSTIVDQ